jgi:ABC-type phosphate/phosphonate transport system substrate-binding protein
VLSGKVDGAAVKDLVLRRLETATPGLRERIRITDTSPPFPENALVVIPSMGERRMRRLKELLLRLPESPAGRQALQALGADRFVDTSDADYANVYAMARETGFPLEAP